MENRRTTVVKGKFPKKFEENNEGYTFLSIAGKLPRIKALPDGYFEAEDCGDSSTIAPEVGKAKDCGHSWTKEAPGVGKSVDCCDSSTKEASGVFGKSVDGGCSSTVAGKDDSIFSNSDGSKYTEEEERMNKEFFSHLNAVGPYDIEMKPPKCLHYPLIPLSLDFLERLKRAKPDAYEKYFLGPAKFALQQINMKENRNYKFDGIVKFVNTPHQQVYVTIAGKEEICTKRDMKCVWTEDKATFQASVYTPYGIGYTSDDYELLEWKRKPDPAAAS